MEQSKKIFLICFVSAMLVISVYSNTLAMEDWKKGDPITDEWNMLDLLVARPLGVAAAIGGVGVFSVSLPFTITVDIFSSIKGKSPGAVKNAAKTFMLNPLKFSFIREFPDENM